MVWSIDDDVWVERDDEGFATQLRHIQSPFSTGTTDPYDLAVDYLGAVKEELGLDRNQIDFLADPAHRPPAGQDWGDTNRKEGEWLRWRQRRDLRPWQEDGAVHFETTVLVLQQTHYVPLPPHLWFLSPFPDVFASGIRIVMHRRSAGELAVTGATSTLRHNFNLAHARALAATPSSPHGLADAVAAPAPTDTAGIAGIAVTSPQHSFIDLIRQVLVLLGFSATKVPAEYDWVLYRYNARREGQQALHPTARFLREHNRSNLVPDSDYPAIMVRISGRPTPAGLEPDTPPIDLFVRFPDPAVLGVAPLMAGAATTADALVFPVDPITQVGYPWPPERLGADKTLRPNRPAAELNPVRQSVTLERLLAPSGTPQMLKLRGDNVIVVEPGEVPIGTIGERPPAEPAGGSFEYDCRTNAFAAVNAYYHLDTMMQRLELFGLPFKEYAPTFDPTLLAIHRAAIRPGPGGDGRCVNAQVRILPDEWSEAGSTPQHKLEFRFALADVAPRPEAEPLGIACDVRWVWHEFGHALIAGATGDLELPFVHSVGDALAAINCDPGSALALPRYNDDAAVLPPHARLHARGVTFPWVTLPNRRHDRKAADGWSWTQRLGQAAGYHQDQSDEAGYHREQVLSSTLFRLYRALGGDAIARGGLPDDDRRRIAADYVTYLIVRAVGSLGRAMSTPAMSASDFATALMDADAGTRLFDYPGQAPQPAPQIRVGGAVHKVVRWAFEKQGLYARDAATSHGEGDPEPVDVYIDDGRDGEYDFTDDWEAAPGALWLRHVPDGQPGPQPVRRNRDNYLYVRTRNRGYQTAFATQVRARVARATTEQWPDAGWTELPAAGGAIGNVPAGGQVVLGPFLWHPTRAGRYTLLVECDAPGDRSNINPATGLPCAQPGGPPSELEDLVPYDNNLAVAPVRVT